MFEINTLPVINLVISLTIKFKVYNYLGGTLHFLDLRLVSPDFIFHSIKTIKVHYVLNKICM